MGEDIVSSLGKGPKNSYELLYDNGIEVKVLQLSFIAVNDPAFHNMFLPMCPTYTFIDRCNGKFNSNMTFKREYAAMIGAAYDIDKIYDRYLSNPDPDYFPEDVLGLNRDDHDYQRNYNAQYDSALQLPEEVLKKERWSIGEP